MQESRLSRRINLPLKVELSHRSIGTLEVEARDMSDGGLFIFLDKYFQLQVGDIATIRVLGLGLSEQDPSPTLTMKVVRVEEDGMGLELLEKEPSGKAASEEKHHYEVVQTLIISDTNKNLLLHKQAGQLEFLTRTINPDESWEFALGQCAQQHLQKAGIDTSSVDTLFGAAHYPPEIEGKQRRIEHIIPCLIQREREQLSYTSENLKSDYQWIAWDELGKISLPLTVDNIESLLQKTTDDNEKIR